MKIRSKLIPGGLAAAAVMALAVGSASGNRLSFTSGAFRVTWSALTFRNATINASCEVTLEGSFHSATIRKNINALIGIIRRTLVTGCRGGWAASILTEAFPYHVTYEGFTGTLPNITGIRYLLRFLLRWVETGGFGISCLYADEPMRKIMTRIPVGAGGAMTGFTPEPTARLRLVEGSFFCDREGELEGTGRITHLGTTTVMSVRLI